MKNTQIQTGCFEQKFGVAQRQSNLELLRILAALFVVILHYNNSSIGKAFVYASDLKLHYEILLFFEAMSICAVNIFVMISGYFLCTAKQVKLWKVLRLYIDVIILSVLNYFMDCWLGSSTFSPKGIILSLIPKNWYVAVYSGLYLIFPYLNRIIQHSTRTQCRFMLLIFFFVLSIWPFGIQALGGLFNYSTTTMNPISLQGHGDGYTLVNFILLYLVGAYFRIFESKSRSVKKQYYAILIWVVCIVLGTILGNISSSSAFSYCSPLVIIQTVATFAVFQNMQFYSKTINVIASCSFGVYLFHQFFYQFCNIQRFVTGNPLLIPAHIVLCALLIYTASALIYWAYQKAFEPIFGWLKRKLDFLSYSQDGLVK